MSNELEQRLERALGQVEPNPSSSEQARAAALAAIPRGGMRARHRLLLAIAAVVAALMLAGGALAASSSVREAVGLSERSSAVHQPRALPNGPLPAGSGGFAAYGGGRLWLASPGFRVAGRPFPAVELSPGGLNVAVGQGQNLDVRRMTDGSLAWRHAAGGRVAGIAWAPIGTEIAYVVHRVGGYQLRVIEGDGDHDRLLAGHVSPVAPSWRADSLAVAYVDGQGRPAVFDLAHLRTTVAHTVRSCPLVSVDKVGFAPRGGLLAASIGDGNMLVADPASGWTRCFAPVVAIGIMPSPQFSWVSGRGLIAADFNFLARVTFDAHRVHVAKQIEAPAGINGLTVSPDRREIALGLWRDDGLHVVTARLPGEHTRSLAMTGRLRSLPHPASPYTLIWR